MKMHAAPHRRSMLCYLLGCASMFAAPAITRAGEPYRGRLEVSGQGLCIKGMVFRKTIPISDLQLAFTRIVDLDQEQELRPWLKLYGVGLPAFRSGWFLLRSHEKALVLLSGCRYAVYIPTSHGCALLLSPDQPEAFLAALQSSERPGQTFSVAAAHEKR